MSKTILITGSTDGIGLETAVSLHNLGHTILLHGRNPTKLAKVEQTLSAQANGERIESYVADLANMAEVEGLATAVAARHPTLDILINNAGVFKTTTVTTSAGLDIRFAVNTIAPYLLTQRLLPLMNSSGRVINLSSAAQAPVNLQALAGRAQISDDFTAYAQSKLALTMWSRAMALSLKESGPSIIAVNPGSMLGTKMVKEAFGVAGKTVRIGADIVVRAALSDEFANASGLYFDNDSGQFASHPDVQNPQKSEEIIRIIEAILAA